MEEAIDYKALLRKYMEIVLRSEGVTFVPRDLDEAEWTNVTITQEELDQLDAMAQEVHGE